jgi:RNA polymerase sigma factor (TIGR02999 family)
MSSGSDAVPPASARPPDDRESIERLMPFVYEELRRIAHRELRGEREGHTLNTTALVHEAFLRLSSDESGVASDRVRFLAAAARAMRRILVDYARRQGAERRGGAWRRLDLDDAAISTRERPHLVIDLDEALERLAGLDERLSRVVECRFFGGLSEEETAEVLGTSVRTVRREWVKARGWLFQELSA